MYFNSKTYRLIGDLMNICHSLYVKHTGVSKKKSLLYSEVFSKRCAQKENPSKVSRNTNTNMHIRVEWCSQWFTLSAVSWPLLWINLMIDWTTSDVVP